MTAKQEISEISTQKLIEEMKRMCKILNAKKAKVRKGERTSLDDQLECWSDGLRSCAAGLHSTIMECVY